MTGKSGLIMQPGLFVQHPTEWQQGSSTVCSHGSMAAAQCVAGLHVTYGIG
jgi:hypothetical protein